MTNAEKIKVWKSNATFVNKSITGRGDIPVSLLQAQLLDAAETVEKLETELNRIRKVL